MDTLHCASNFDKDEDELQKDCDSNELRYFKIYINFRSYIASH